MGLLRQQDNDTIHPFPSIQSTSRHLTWALRRLLRQNLPDMATTSPTPMRRPGSIKALRLLAQVLAALLVSIFIGIAAAPAHAQIRPIPAEAKLATLKLGVFPDAELNGKAVKLGPGARIYNQDNIIVVPSTLLGVTTVVAYVTGSLGEVVSLWILKDAEIQQMRARQKRSR